MMKAIFERIYEKGKWVSREGVPRAGAGSTSKYCKDIYEGVLPWTEGRVFVDLGCNEKENWLPQHLTQGPAYFGIDIVEAVKPHLVADLTDVAAWWDKTPEGPKFFFIKDVLQHWPDETISEWLESMGQKMSSEDFLCTINGCRAKEGPRDFKGQYAPLKWGFPPFEETKSYPFEVTRIMESWKPRTKEVLIWKVLK